jgi:hypothetical protein
MSILEFIIGVCLMIVVAIQYGVVDQLHLLLLLSPAFRDLLFRCLALAERRGIRSIDLVHEVAHQFLAEAVEGGSAECGVVGVFWWLVGL